METFLAGLGFVVSWIAGMAILSGAWDTILGPSMGRKRGRDCE